MFCPMCGHELRGDAKFCPNCGTSLAGRGVRRSAGDDSSASSVSKAITAVNKAASDTLPPKGAAPSADGHPSEPNTPPAASVPSGQAMVYLGLDVVMFILVTFVPWVGSYFTSRGQALSLPSLALEGLNLISEASKYSSTAKQWGVGNAYGNMLASMFFVVAAAAIGWFVVVRRLWQDARCDLKYQEAAGRGGRDLVVLAIVVQALVWIGEAGAKSSLKGSYVDFSSLGVGILQTTGWVWVSMAVGLGANYLRKNFDRVTSDGTVGSN